MPSAPSFWQTDGLLPRMLAPASLATRTVTAARLRKAGWFCPIPVICVGNVTLGGAGKTTVTLDLAHRLIGRGWNTHVLLRGYGGAVHGLHNVRPDDTASLVGDEALLHAACAPTWVCADRARAAQALVAACAEVVLMDDGLQNPGVRKDCSILVVDGATGFGNGRVFPAGPLREPISAAAARCQAAVLIGDDLADAQRQLPPILPLHRARLVPGPEASALAGKRVLAFAGLALPEKFFATLKSIGAEPVALLPFPDHHPYNAAEIDALLQQARQRDAMPVTTAKDAARLPSAVRDHVHVLTVSLAWDDPGAPDALLHGAINHWASQGRYRRSYA